MDTKEIEQQISLAKRILEAIASEETQNDFEELKELIEAAVEVAFDLVREPLEAAGIELGQSRSLHSFEWKEKFNQRFEKLTAIEPYE